MNINIPYRFTGQESDFDLNLHNFRARNYACPPSFWRDADLGMFYAVDQAGTTSSPYGYARQNPISFIIPKGILLQL